MTSIGGNPAQKDWAKRIEQLTPVERQNRTKAVDILLEKPEEMNDVLECELWKLREQLQSPS